METKSPEASLILEKAIEAIKGAETLFFEGRKLHSGVIPETYRQLNLSEPVTRQRYYSWSSDGVEYARVESAVAIGELNLTTVFVKNQEGIWDVLPQCSAEVSVIFKRDQLLGIFPFFRFFSTLRYPYELSLGKECHDDLQQFVVKGHLRSKPCWCEDDISSRFAYIICANHGRLRSLREETFGGRMLHLVLDTISTDQPID